MKSRLQLLAASQVDAEPYDFAEFQRRAAERAVEAAHDDREERPVWRVLRVAAVVVPVALVLTITAVSRQGAPAPLDEPAFDSWASEAEPALVHAGSESRISDLEDRIAFIDSMLSATPVTSSDRAVLQDGRRAMADSLQQVRYAQVLLTY